MPTSNPTALPARWRRGRRVASAGALILSALVAWILRPSGAADRLDAWWLSARFSIRERMQPGIRQDPDIVLALLDDKCASKWKEPLIAWGPHIADALNRLRTSGAKVVALDWYQPESTEKYFPGNDTRLQNALAEFKDGNIVLVELSSLNQFDTKDKSVPAYIHTYDRLLYAVPTAGQNGAESIQGIAELDSSFGITYTLRPVQPGDQNAPSFAARIAEKWFGEPGDAAREFWEIPGRVRVPLRRDGTVLPDYANGTGYSTERRVDDPAGLPFARVSLYDICALPLQPDPRFRDKIVLIGSAMTGGNDQHFVPFFHSDKRPGNRPSDGVEIQANFVRALLSDRIVREPQDFLLWMICMALAVAAVAAFLRMPWLPAGLTVLGIAGSWILASIAVFCGRSVALPITLPLTTMLISAACLGGYLAFSEERERRQVMNLWGRYQDPRLVNYLLANPEARGGEGREEVVTVLFADLKDFTKTVENMPPGEALSVLNRYLAMLESVIRTEHGGVVDKYLGDGLMAQWGAPAAPGNAFRSDHAHAATAACLDILKRGAELTAQEPETQGFSLRLTLHTGPVIVGWVGATRLEFTIIGDTVNVTSRLQETAKSLDVAFLISETTYAAVKDSVHIGKQADVEIRGRKQTLQVYEIVGDVRP